MKLARAMKLTIVITGGHATPALAVLEVFKQRGHKAIWFGEKEAHTGKAKAETLEYQVIPKMGVSFFQIFAPKFHRRDIIKTLLGIWKLPVGVGQSISLLVKIKPDVVLSFGSYLAVPVAIAAFLLGIPVITHEQTAVSGLANRIVGFFAKKIALTFASSASYFPVKKAVITGNPMRSSIFAIAKKRKSGKNKRKILYITGGSRGSRIINKVILQILPDLVKNFFVIHQCGQLDYPEFEKLSKQNYEVSANYSTAQIDEILSKVDLVISRAGANTVLELAAVGIPSILIPIPNSSGDEQSRNAQELANTGLAFILPESKLTAESLLEKVRYMSLHLPKFTARANDARKLASASAAEQVANLVEVAHMR